MTHLNMARVVYDYQPCLVVRCADGSAESDRGHEVQYRAVFAKRQDLLPASPSRPAQDDTLAGA